MIRAMTGKVVTNPNHRLIRVVVKTLASSATRMKICNPPDPGLVRYRPADKSENPVEIRYKFLMRRVFPGDKLDNSGCGL